MPPRARNSQGSGPSAAPVVVVAAPVVVVTEADDPTAPDDDALPSDADSAPAVVVGAAAASPPRAGQGPLGWALKNPSAAADSPQAPPPQAPASVLLPCKVELGFAQKKAKEETRKARKAKRDDPSHDKDPHRRVAEDPKVLENASKCDTCGEVLRRRGPHKCTAPADAAANGAPTTVVVPQQVAGVEAGGSSKKMPTLERYVDGAWVASPPTAFVEVSVRTGRTIFLVRAVPGDPQPVSGSACTRANKAARVVLSVEHSKLCEEMYQQGEVSRANKKSAIEMHDRLQRGTSDPLDLPDFTVVEKWFKARLARGNAKGKDGFAGADDWRTVVDETSGKEYWWSDTLGKNNGFVKATEDAGENG